MAYDKATNLKARISNINQQISLKKRIAEKQTVPTIPSQQSPTGTSNEDLAAERYVESKRSIQDIDNELKNLHSSVGARTNTDTSYLDEYNNNIDKSRGNIRDLTSGKVSDLDSTQRNVLGNSYRGRVGAAGDYFKNQRGNIQNQLNNIRVAKAKKTVEVSKLARATSDKLEQRRIAYSRIAYSAGRDYNDAVALREEGDAESFKLTLDEMITGGDIDVSSIINIGDAEVKSLAASTGLSEKIVHNGLYKAREDIIEEYLELADGLGVEFEVRELIRADNFAGALELLEEVSSGNRRETDREREHDREKDKVDLTGKRISNARAQLNLNKARKEGQGGLANFEGGEAIDNLVKTITNTEEYNAYIPIFKEKVAGQERIAQEISSFGANARDELGLDSLGELEEIIENLNLELTDGERVSLDAVIKTQEIIDSGLIPQAVLLDDFIPVNGKIKASAFIDLPGISYAQKKESSDGFPVDPDSDTGQEADVEGINSEAFKAHFSQHLEGITDDEMKERAKTIEYLERFYATREDIKVDINSIIRKARRQSFDSGKADGVIEDYRKGVRDTFIASAS